jgi:uncharacterized protein YqhQ
LRDLLKFDTPSPERYTPEVPQGEYLQYGGQAIVEGVMMRSPHNFAVAVRAPNNEIIVHAEPLAKTWIGRQKWLKLPFLRGSLALLDAMALGIRAMHFASNVQLDPKYAEQEPGQQPAEAKDAVEAMVGTPEEGPAAYEPVVTEEAGYSDEGSRIVEHGKGGSESLRKIAVGGTMVVGLAFGLFLFVFLPNLVGQLFQRVGVTDQFWLNFISGLLKLVIFIGYIWLISRMHEIRRVFQYHGAEHKAINTLENGLPLTLENCKVQTRLHPRCGTSFAIIVLIIDIAILTFLPRYVLGEEAPVFLNLLIRFGYNLALLPIIAGIAYEAIRFAGKFRNQKYVQAMFAPGLATQYLTTVEPDDDQIEVALVALRRVVDDEEKAAQKPPEKEDVVTETAEIA